MTLARISMLFFVAAAAPSCGSGLFDPTTTEEPDPGPSTTANAGPDQWVDHGAVVTLNGGGSTARAGTELVSWAWKQSAGPALTLTGASSVTSEFTAPPVSQPTTFELTLTVTDSAGGEASDALVVTVAPRPCAPATCLSAAKSCGTLDDGCGGTVKCGSCTAPATCGGGGVANVCGQAAGQGFAYPFGASGLQQGTTGMAPFTMWLGGTSAAYLLSDLSKARAAKMRLFLNMTGGAHENYLTNGVFDLAKWKAKMDTFNTPQLKQAVAAAVADGTIIGNSVMDEPHVHGLGDGNTWGPPGTMTKAKVDELCRYVKAIFPTLPTGVAHRHDVFEPDQDYAVCELVVSQYSARAGDVVAFRDAGLAFAERSGIAILFSMNVLNGGTQDKDGTWDCTGTGGKGQYAPNCRMTAAQVKDFGLALAPAGCGMNMWRYDATFFGRPDNQASFQAIADRVKGLPGKPCVRP